MIYKKYFWKKQLEFIILQKPYSNHMSLFKKKISIFYISKIIPELVKVKRNFFLSNKPGYLLIYGKIIMYKSGQLILFIENFKFKIEKTRSITNQNVINLIRNYNLILNIGASSDVFNLLPLI